MNRVCAKKGKSTIKSAAPFLNWDASSIASSLTLRYKRRAITHFGQLRAPKRDPLLGNQGARGSDRRVASRIACGLDTVGHVDHNVAP